MVDLTNIWPTFQELSTFFGRSVFFLFVSHGKKHHWRLDKILSSKHHSTLTSQTPGDLKRVDSSLPQKKIHGKTWKTHPLVNSEETQNSWWRVCIWTSCVYLYYTYTMQFYIQLTKTNSQPLNLAVEKQTFSFPKVEQLSELLVITSYSQIFWMRSPKIQGSILIFFNPGEISTDTNTFTLPKCLPWSFLCSHVLHFFLPQLWKLLQI